MVQAIPDGFHTISPYLTVRGAGELLDFLKRAFDAKETECLAPDGTVRHAQVQIGDSMVMMGECPPDFEPARAHFYVYVDDVDAWFKRAVDAGAEVVSEPADQFYGDRHGGVKDAWGNIWYLATHIEDVSPEEIAKRAATAMAEGGANQAGPSEEG